MSEITPFRVGAGYCLMMKKIQRATYHEPFGKSHEAELESFNYSEVCSSNRRDYTVSLTRYPLVDKKAQGPVAHAMQLISRPYTVRPAGQYGV